MDHRTDSTDPTTNDELVRLIAEWRTRKSAESDRLSPTTRGRILASARSGQTETSPLADLFLPTRRWLWAGLAPALVLAVALGWIGESSERTPTHAGQATLPVHATKVGGEVVFVIANGGRPHNIYRSTHPGEFGRTPLQVTRDGSFRDRLQGGPDLVFYRID